MTDADTYTFPDVIKDPGASKKVRLDLYAACANRWRANEAYSAAEYVRPRTPKSTGFAYECTTAGLSGANEPRWPRAIGETVPDGSIVWTCRAAALNGLNVLSAPSAVADPTGGLTVESVSVEEGHKLLATYVGGTLGQDYDAVFSFTLDGVPQVARQRVLVRKR